MTRHIKNKHVGIEPELNEKNDTGVHETDNIIMNENESVLDEPTQLNDIVLSCPECNFKINKSNNMNRHIRELHTASLVFL